MVDTRDSALAATNLIQDSGGEVVGRTRIQKAAYFLECMGLGSGFEFYYKHFGPYSDELANALRYARELGLTEEEDRKAVWGGIYTIFKSDAAVNVVNENARNRALVVAKGANPVALELAATALFLAREGEADPWSEVRDLKRSKATRENLLAAKRLYEAFREIDAPRPLPALQ